jgi:hypothetical protein
MISAELVEEVFKPAEFGAYLKWREAHPTQIEGWCRKIVL